MSASGNFSKPKLRALLVLGRVSNLPTVWSNCLAGWLLATDRLQWLPFLLLCLGTTFLYVGGMYLNDAFDAEFDRQHRRERPIPSGVVSEAEVWTWGLGWLGVGLLALAFLGGRTGLLALILAGAIFLYDAIHKMITFSPLLMALCRFLLYVIAASAASTHLVGLPIWSGLALAAYIVGLSYLARQESTGGFLDYWPAFLLATPLLLALLVNDGAYRMRGILLCLIVAIWIVRCLRHAYWAPQRNIGRTVSGLLAGIVLVDFLAIGGGTPAQGSVFILLFLSALLFQRYIPAT